MAKSESNKKKRKLIIFLFIIVLVIILAAVGFYIFRYDIKSMIVKRNSDSTAEIPVQDGSGDSNILIAYFTLGEVSDVDVISSASVTAVDRVAKGNVRGIADMIQEKTGGDLFSIQTVKKYDKSYFDVISAAKNEIDSNERPELSDHIKNFDKYDVVFVGYPTWWYDIPQALYTFFDEYDFSGKTIIPFNSANGSKFGKSISSIESLEPNADVIENSISIDQDDVKKAKDDVEKWLDELGY